MGRRGYYFFLGGGGGRSMSRCYRRKNLSPDFRSPEVGISGTCEYI